MKIRLGDEFQQINQKIGVPMKKILERAGVPNVTWQEKIDLTSVHYYRLMEEFDQIVTDEQLVAFSDVKNLQQFLPPIYAALSAKNGLEAIRRLSEYKQVIGPIKLELTTKKDVVSIRIHYIDPNQPMPRFSVLNEQLLLISLLRTGTGKQIKPQKIASNFEYGNKLTELIGIKPQQSGTNFLDFSLADLAIPFLTENNAMWEYLEPEMKRRLQEERTEESFLGTLQDTLLSAIPSGRFNVEDVAQTLGLSARTLQRKLKQEDTSYRAEVHRIQKSLTLGYFQYTDLDTPDIAYLVGYSDEKSLARAFKSWTGQTISSYKKQKVNE